jgi:CBS domain-containing protein
MNTTVGEVMTCQVMAAREEADFKEIVAVLRHGRVSALPVLDSENRVIGVVSEADLLAKEAAADGEHAVVEMGGTSTANEGTRATEASVRGFWKCYRSHMGV